jgi:hypothetical protein
VARWLGWSTPNLSQADALKLWDIVEVGIGGKVIGRSAEKVLPEIVESMKKGKRQLNPIWYRGPIPGKLFSKGGEQQCRLDTRRIFPTGSASGLITS